MQQTQQQVRGSAAQRSGQRTPVPVRPLRSARSSNRVHAGAATQGRTRVVSCQAVLTPQKPAQGNASPTVVELPRDTQTTRPRVVVLGSGWGAMSFIKALPETIKDKYELIVVSPRNYFLYTPLLPAVATGTMEERSIVEPVRNLVVKKGDYYEALATDIDPVKKELVCCFPADAGFPEACFKVNYDILIVSVGSVNNTFGIKGVDQYCHYFKTIEDANSLRRRVSECFERAALPATSDEERRKLLSFVVVGGGPTGVEVAAEMYDMINEDLIKLYPNLIKDVEIRIIELMDHVLSTYDRAISIYTAEQFKRAGVKLVLNSRVAAVEDGVVKVVNKANEMTDIPFGACVWATGIAMNPLIRMMQEKLPGQGHFRSILTDDFLRVKGSDGSIWALGDAATIDQPKALEHAEELFEKADTNKDGKLSLGELRDILQDASKQFSHLEEHARFLDLKAGGAFRFGKLVGNALPNGPLSEVGDEVTREEFKDILGKVDKGLRSLPATAQVANQQGKYLASLFAKHLVTGDPKTAQMDNAQSFKYFHKGSAAYVGNDKAVFDVPSLGPLTGTGAGVVWKSYETLSQFSFRNQCLVAADWLRTKIFGRDISRV